MEEQIISFETAKLAKEKMFNIEVMYGYGEDKELYQKYRNFYEWNFKDTKYGFISAPTQSLLQKWLREVHNLIVIPIYGNNSYWFNIFNSKNNYLLIGSILLNLQYNSYEEALEVGLLETLKLIK